MSHAKLVHELLLIPANIVLEIVVISHAFFIHMLVVHRANFPCQVTLRVVRAGFLVDATPVPLSVVFEHELDVSQLATRVHIA